MTTAVARARPEEVLRGAALLGATADDLATAISACRRSAAVTWVGRAQEQYQRRLGSLADDLFRVRSAFDTACEALLCYARALAYAQPLAEEADRLEAAGELTRVPDLRWEAEQTEQSAAARLILVLEDLVEAAPRRGAWTSVQHDLANFASGLEDAAKGVGSTVVSLFHALPGVGSPRSRSDARDAVVESAEDSLQPWKQVQELVDAVEQGRGWRTSGAVAGAAVFRFRGARGKHVELFGTHDHLPVGVLGALARGLALAPGEVLDSAVLTRLRHDLVAGLLAFERLPALTLEELLDQPVDLVRHEAGEGHTLLRHVGRDLDFLQRRQLLDRRTDGSARPVSSFSTLDVAEEAVGRLLHDKQERIVAWLHRGSRDPLKLIGSARDPLGLLVDTSGRSRVPTKVVVYLVRDAVNRIHIRTAFLD